MLWNNFYTPVFYTPKVHFFYTPPGISKNNFYTPIFTPLETLWNNFYTPIFTPLAHFLHPQIPKIFAPSARFSLVNPYFYTPTFQKNSRLRRDFPL